MNLRLRLAFEWIAIGLLASAVALAILWSEATSSFDELFYDTLSTASAPPADSNVLLVAIDDQSLDALGRWPWDRATHARLIDILSAQRPRTVTLDILMSEPTASDAVLAAAMARSQAPVILPLHFRPSTRARFGEDAVMPSLPLQRAAKAIGHVNMIFDTDGIVRKVSLCFRTTPTASAWPHISTVINRAGDGVTPAFAANCQQHVRFPFARRGTFAEISYLDLLNGNVPADFVRGRDVIVGSTAVGMGDLFPTPNGEGGLLPGSEVIANILGAQRRGDFVSTLPAATNALLSLIPLWLLMFGFLKWQPRTALYVSVITIIMTLGLSALLLSSGTWFPPGAALAGILAVYPLWGWRRLQAMSDFMTTRLARLDTEHSRAALLPPVRPALDVVGRQSEALAGAIDQLGNLRRYLRDTLAGLPDPMFVTDLSGKITLGNQMFEQGLGLKSAPQTLGDVIDEIVDPKHRSLVDAYLETATCKAPEYVRFSAPDGRSFVMRKSAVTSDRDIVQGHIFYLTDITALARAEAQREEVLQLLSHDMRAPQSTIIALLDGEITDDSKKRIERHARRTMQLAQDFVEIARMAEAEFVGEDILIADFVREAADGLWPLARERGIRFEFNDRSESAFITGEPGSLARAMTNLLDNAIKFSPDDGVIRIDIDSIQDDQQSYVNIVICDDGTGIDPDILPQLFGRFISSEKQVGRTKGTGLGLMFVHAVMERHNGAISGRNRDEGGACFTLTLPEASPIA